MLSFVIMACLSQSPSVCVTERMPIEGNDFSGGSCMRMMPELTQVWQDLHAKEWIVQETKCESRR